MEERCPVRPTLIYFGKKYKYPNKKCKYKLRNGGEVCSETKFNLLKKDTKTQIHKCKYKPRDGGEVSGESKFCLLVFLSPSLY